MCICKMQNSLTSLDICMNYDHWWKLKRLNQFYLITAFYMFLSSVNVNHKCFFLRFFIFLFSGKSVNLAGKELFLLNLLLYLILLNCMHFSLTFQFFIYLLFIFYLQKLLLKVNLHNNIFHLCRKIDQNNFTGPLPTFLGNFSSMVVL